VLPFGLPRHKIKQFIGSSENCRRQFLLKALGSPEEQQPTHIMCCDSCSPGELPDHLNLVPLPSVPAGRRKSVRVHPVPKGVCDEHYEALVAAREKVVTINSGLRMLEPEIVCSSKVISDLCKKAGHINSVDDLKCFKGLRVDLYDLFFNVISEIVLCPRYRRRKS